MHTRRRAVPTLLARALALWIVSGLLPASALSQVNIEAKRSFDTDGVAASIQGDFTLLSGNAELYEVGIGTRFDYREQRHYTFLIGSLRYGETRGAAFKNHAFAHWRYNYTTTDWLVGELFSQIERDGFTLLQVRLLGGTGVRFRYLHENGLGLYQGTALMVEHERLDVRKLSRHPAQVTVLRWSNYLNLRIGLTEHVSFVNTVYVQPQLDAFGDIRVLDDAVLAVELTEHVTLTTALNLRYDSRPPDRVESLDVALRNGLVVEF